MSDLTIQSRITPFLWFNDNAEEAADFYCSVFKNARKVGEFRGGPAPAGKPLTVTFEIEGLRFVALNGGPMFHFTEAVSFVVSCADQDEVDYFFETHRRWRAGEPMRLAERQVRALVANRSGANARSAPESQGCGSHDEDEEARHPRARARRKGIAGAPSLSVGRGFSADSPLLFPDRLCRIHRGGSPRWNEERQHQHRDEHSTRR